MPILEITALVMLGLAALGAITLVVVGLLTFGYLVDWFRDRAARIKRDSSKLAVTVAEDISSGNVSYVQGIFDTDQGKFTTARRIKADDVDSDVTQVHANHKVAVWE